MSAKPTSKRLVCPTCSKPARVCLCNRIQNPGLENLVNVTILQHSLEKNHPINSARIATLGLKNITIVNITDVNFEARFDIRLLDSDMKMASSGCDPSCCSLSVCKNVPESSSFDAVIENVSGVDSDYMEYIKKIKRKKLDNDEEYSLSNNQNCVSKYHDHMLEPKLKLTTEESIDSGGALGLNSENINANTLMQVASDLDGAVQSRNELPAITATVGKYGLNCEPQIQGQTCNFDQIFDFPNAVESLVDGFAVKKFQKRQLNGTTEIEEHEEFELEVPRGTILLFPSDEAISIDDLEARKISVKNLIVLDGTWAKAKRMYHENPWLKFLPHLKLDLNKMSLYSEVRQQPKVGYLSTIESIVYTLKALGDNREELDNLLDVFESMVVDQRRCKNERLSKESLV